MDTTGTHRCRSIDPHGISFVFEIFSAASGPAHPYDQSGGGGELAPDQRNAFDELHVKFQGWCERLGILPVDLSSIK